MLLFSVNIQMYQPSRKALKVINQSYAKLRDITGIDRAVWSRYFNGKQNPEWETMESIAQQLGLEFDEFVVAFLDRRKRTIAKHGES